MSTTTEPSFVIDASDGSRWELVSGLEVHAELATATKMFSGAPNRFGDGPNTNIDPVTLGLPGSLPVLNGHAVELAIRLGLALGCSIEPSVFSRKNYFYPDMPKDFQISQYDLPINVGGSLELPSGKVVGIERAHLEEDTANQPRPGRAHHRVDYSMVEYNGPGVPLLESCRGRKTLAREARITCELRRPVPPRHDGRMDEGSCGSTANVSPPCRSTSWAPAARSRPQPLRSLGGPRSTRTPTGRAIMAANAYPQTRHWPGPSVAPPRALEERPRIPLFPEPDLVPLGPGAMEDGWAAMPPSRTTPPRLAAAGGGRVWLRRPVLSSGDRTPGHRRHPSGARTRARHT